MKDKTRRPSKKNSKRDNKKYPYKKVRKEIDKPNKDGQVKDLLVLAVIFLLLVLLNDNIVVNLNQKQEIEITLPSQIISYCSSGNLIDDARCVNRLTNQFYKYNISNLDKELSFNELQEYGGTCEHWSKYYCSFGERLGYYTTILSFKTIQEEDYAIYHQFCVWSNEFAYVAFDGGDIMEASFKGFNITEVEDLIYEGSN